MASRSRPFRRRMVLNTASTGAANLWAIVVAVVSLPLLVRGLGTATFGTWVLLQTFSATTGWVSLLDLGLGTAVTRTVAERLGRDDRPGVTSALWSTVAVYAALSAACAIAMATAGTALLPGLFRTPSSLRDDLRLAIVVFAVQVAIELSTEGFEAVLEGLQRVDLSRLVDSVRRTAVAVAASAAALAGGGLRGVAIASLGGSAVGALLGALVLSVEVGRLQVGLERRPARFSKETVKELLVYGRTVAILRPIGVLHRTMDRLIAGIVLGPGAVALVEIATQIQNGANAMLSASAYAVVPGASFLEGRGDRERLRELLARGTRYSLLLTMPVVVASALLSGPIIRLWVGEKYAEAQELAVVALAYVAVTALVHVGSNLLLGTGRAPAILAAAAAAAVLNLAASIVLIHTVGLIGVFIGTLAGAVVLVPLLARAFLHEFGTGPGEFVRSTVTPVLPPVAMLAAATGTIVALPLPDIATLIAGTAAGGLAFAVAFVMNRRGRDELRDLLAAVAGRGAEDE